MHRVAAAIAALTTFVASGAVPEAAAQTAACSSAAFRAPHVAGTAGITPFNVVTTDFNGDGRVDIATAGSDGTAVLLGDGAGRFGPATFFPRQDTLDVVAADFNGDGRIDLASAWTLVGESEPGEPPILTGTIDVRLGDGAGGFAPVTSIPAGEEPRAIVAADFDGNGTIDLAAADGAGAQVLLLAGDGTGGFAAPSLVPLSRSATGIAAGDFDADGHVDFAVTAFDEASPANSGVLVMMGDGTGDFEVMPVIRTGLDPLDIVAADLNGDGRLDLATVGSDRFRRVLGRLDVFRGDGAGGFVLHAAVQLFATPIAVAAGDLNGDGRTDLAVRDYAVQQGFPSSWIRVVLQQPGGGLAAPATFRLPTADTNGLAVADLDADARPDIVTPAVTIGGSVLVMLNACGDVADLEAGITRSPETPVAGRDVISYTFSVRNLGPHAAASYLTVDVAEGAELRGTGGTGFCIQTNVPGPPFSGARLQCGFGDLPATPPANERTVVVHVVMRGEGGALAVSGFAGTSVIDPNPMNNAVSDTVVTRVIGGRGLKIAAGAGGGTLLRWTGGDAQTGYFVVRFVGGVATTFPENGLALPADTTSFTDEAPVPGQANCYTVTPVDESGTPFTRSDLLCLLPGTAVGTGLATASLELNQSHNMRLEWSEPADATGYLVAQQYTDTDGVSTSQLRAGNTVLVLNVGDHPTCVTIAPYNGSTQLGRSDALCGLPGYSTLPP